MVLGTAQIGLNYGPNKELYKVSYQRANELFLSAYEFGIRELDTALGYGQSHHFIGQYHRQASHRFGVYTKITIEDFNQNKNVVKNLAEELGIEQFEGVLLHRGEDALNVDLKKYLFKCKEDGLIKKIGLSVYYDQNFQELVSAFRPDFVQIPYNALDNSNIRKQEIDFLLERNIEIHTRSCFLRGALINPKGQAIPEGLYPWLEKVNVIAEHAQCSLASLCLNYSLRSPFISKVVIGVDQVEQLNKNMEDLKSNILDKCFAEIDQLKISDPSLLDIRKWS